MQLEQPQRRDLCLLQHSAFLLPLPGYRGHEFAVFVFEHFPLVLFLFGPLGIFTIPAGCGLQYAKVVELQHQAIEAMVLSHLLGSTYRSIRRWMVREHSHVYTC